MMTMKEAPIVTMMTLYFFMLYIFNKYHIMNNLIICEFIVIKLIIIIFVVNSAIQMENYMILFILIVLISESVMGLSLMVNMIRTHSNDFIKSMTLIKF